MLAKVNSAALIGLNAVPVELEVDIATQGLPTLNIVGLPDKAVEEAKERVRSALKNTGAEFPEFPRHVLEAMHQPMEDGFVTISRVSGRIKFSSNFLLIAAQNPCPCGYVGDPTHECKNSISQIIKYQKKVSGPMLDRIDIHLDIPAVKTDKLISNKGASSPSSLEIRKRVQSARDIQTKRFKNESSNTKAGKIVSNSEMSSKQIKKYCPLDSDSEEILKLAVKNLGLSARSFKKIIKIRRTIADLEKSKNIKSNHIAEALQYRPKIDNQ